MDAYAFAVDALRADDCRRLRAYVAEANVPFASWLIVVTRRLVLDFVRHRYGRSRSSVVERQQEQQTRRRLEDLLAAELDPDELTRESDDDAEAVVRRRDLMRALAHAVATLNPTDQLLLALRFEDERTARDIAGTLGLPTVFHVYRRLTAILSTLRSRLRERGVDEAEP